MGALFYKTPITVKGIIGMMLVVSGSFSYAWERINNKRGDSEKCERDPIVKKENGEKEVLLTVDSKA